MQSWRFSLDQPGFKSSLFRNFLTAPSLLKKLALVNVVGWALHSLDLSALARTLAFSSSIPINKTLLKHWQWLLHSSSAHALKPSGLGFKSGLFLFLCSEAGLSKICSITDFLMQNMDAWLCSLVRNKLYEHRCSQKIKMAF